MTFLAMLGLMIMAMEVTVISMTATTLSLSQIQRHRRIGLRPRTTTSEVHYHLFDGQLSCLHRLSDDGSESVSSDMFVMSPEQPRTDEISTVNMDGTRSAASSETAVQETVGNKRFGNQTAMRLRSLGSRHVLVKDTAFQT